MTKRVFKMLICKENIKKFEKVLTNKKYVGTIITSLNRCED